MENNHIKILYVLVAVLLAGLVAFAYVDVKNSKSTSSAQMLGIAASTTIPSIASTTPDITVGAGGPAQANVYGTLVELNGNTMKLKDMSGMYQGATSTVSITANTKFQIGGELKDQATQQKELAAYNAQVTLLMKDPAKNKAALAAMRLPSIQAVTPATIADFKVGDQVLVVASSVDASGTYIATLVTKQDPQ